MPTIGRYEILEQLGSGSMGTVYKGRDTLLDRMVAIKTIRTGVNVELEAKERFYREARTCARLTHPHIVAVYDLGEENGTSFIAMELLDGSDFRQLIERKEALTVPAKLTAMAQVCEALAYAHRAGVIHRDIKPSNLFLPSDCRVKVVDFGIAKLPTSHLTRAGSILGTPNYMAPEQINGLACDGRADLFSAAVVFFEFLTYHHPFKSNLIPRRIMEDKPDSLLEQDPTLPVILEKIFTKALAKNPDDRYATGDDFAADLRAVHDAVTQNSSPTFSRVELPSQHSFAVPPHIPVSEAVTRQTSAMKAVPDSQEWRVVRMQKLLPAFDVHLAARDVQSARNSLTEMQSVAGDDPRYRDPIESARSRLAQLETPQPTSESVATVRCAKCANVNRADAIFCVGCGAALAQGTGTSTAVKAAPPPVVTPPQTTKTTSVPKSQPISKTQSVPLPIPTTKTQQAPNINPTQVRTQTGAQATQPGMAKFSDRNKLFAAIGIVAVAGLLLIVAPLFFRSVKQETAVASAVVTAQEAHLLATASDNGNIITKLERGAQVNILTLPTSLTQGWVRVQARSGSKYLEPGYLKAPDLAEWDSKDPNNSLALARMSGPLDAGTDAEMRAQVDKLKSVAATFAGKAAAGLASLDAAKLEIILAKHMREVDPTSPGWQASITDLQSRLENLKKDPALQRGSDELLKQIQDIPPMAEPAQQPLVETPSTPDIPQPPPEMTPAEVQHYLTMAQQSLKESRYTDALAQVGRILKSQPQNSDAQALRKKIKDQVEFEKSLR